MSAGLQAREPAEGLDFGSSMRYVTVLFTDLCSSVGLAAQMDCLDFVALLRDLRILCRSTVARHRGIVARLQGDGMLAIFGLEGSPDDGSQGAICCALELRRAVSAIALNSGGSCAALHSGIHAGWTYLECGDLERGRFDVVGNVPNLAARLSSLAERNDILATEDVIGPRLSQFSVGERLSLGVRGWPDPIQVYPVLGHSWSRRASHSALVLAPTAIRTRDESVSMISPRSAQAVDGTRPEDSGPRAVR
ncbi:adenylate/guanylate cyclase domain-containing protein [Variovorax sp. LjRoot290]|uniref:adenylate/guanylate cyclase domain-containing protein n=1 Tax=Variovorax sp. LjRoot290 TaxID=3342316 RepID=UPI003ECD847E